MFLPKRNERKLLYAVLFPAIVEGLLSQLFSMIDGVMVGHMPESTSSVAAISMCSAPINLFVLMAVSFFVGTNAVVAFHYGEQNEKEVRNTAWQSLLLAVAAGGLISLITYSFSDSIIGFICGESEVYETAALYFRINSIGFAFQIISVCASASYRGISKAKIPMLYNIFGNAVNVILNYILIYGKIGFPALGVKGAAIATVISKILIFLISVGSLFFYRSPIRFRKDITLKPSPVFLHRLIPIGLGASAEEILLQIGAILTTKVIAILPTADLAANQVVCTLECFGWSTASSCDVASTSLVGRCLGEKNVKKGQAFLYLTELWALIFTVTEASVFCFGGRMLAPLLSNDEALYPTIVRLLLLMSASLPFINTHRTFSGALRASGDAKAPLIASCISFWIFRLGLSFLAIRVLNLGIDSYRVCFLLDQSVRMIANLIFYFSGHWKKYNRES